MITTIIPTDEHVKNGHRFNCTRCPIALAIKEHVKPNVQVTVDPSIVSFYFKDKPATFLRLPNRIERFIISFDYSMHTKIPKSFELDIPKEYLKDA